MNNIKCIYPCPCCGYKIFSLPPQDDQICNICFWQNDPYNLRYPLDGYGPNKVTLYEAQKNFQEFGACEERLKPYVRKPTENDVKDSEWRPIDLAKDQFYMITKMNKEEITNMPFVEDKTQLYYWKKH